MLNMCLSEILGGNRRNLSVNHGNNSSSALWVQIVARDMFCVMSMYSGCVTWHCIVFGVVVSSASNSFALSLS